MPKKTQDKTKEATSFHSSSSTTSRYGDTGTHQSRRGRGSSRACECVQGTFTTTFLRRRIVNFVFVLMLMALLLFVFAVTFLSDKYSDSGLGGELPLRETMISCVESVTGWTAVVVVVAMIFLLIVRKVLFLRYWYVKDNQGKERSEAGRRTSSFHRENFIQLSACAAGLKHLLNPHAAEGKKGGNETVVPQFRFPSSLDSDYLVLCRHGERADHLDDNNAWLKQNTFLSALDPPLSERGRQQSFELASWWLHKQSKRGTGKRRFAVSCVLTSPFQRCIETAIILATSLEVPVFVDIRLADWHSPKLYPGKKRPTINGTPVVVECSHKAAVTNNNNCTCNSDSNTSSKESDDDRNVPLFAVSCFENTAFVQHLEKVYGIPAGMIAQCGNSGSESSKTKKSQAPKREEERKRSEKEPSLGLSDDKEQIHNEGEMDEFAKRKLALLANNLSSYRFLPFFSGDTHMEQTLPFPESRGALGKRCERFVREIFDTRIANYVESKEEIEASKRRNLTAEDDDTKKKTNFSARKAIYTSALHRHSQETRSGQKCSAFLSATVESLTKNANNNSSQLPPQLVICVTHADVISQMVESICPRFAPSTMTIPYCSMTRLRRENGHQCEEEQGDAMRSKKKDEKHVHPISSKNNNNNNNNEDHQGSMKDKKEMRTEEEENEATRCGRGGGGTPQGVQNFLRRWEMESYADTSGIQSLVKLRF